MNAPDILPPPSYNEQKPGILVVEDKVELRFALAEWLRIQEHTVLEASSADEAMEVLRSPLKIHLVVTDVHMPGSMNGLDLAHRIHADFPWIKVIVVSGESDRMNIEKNTLFFRKPYDLKHLADHITQLLAEGMAP